MTNKFSCQSCPNDQGTGMDNWRLTLQFVVEVKQRNPEINNKKMIFPYIY